MSSIGATRCSRVAEIDEDTFSSDLNSLGAHQYAAVVRLRKLNDNNYTLTNLAAQNTHGF